MTTTHIAIADLETDGALAFLAVRDDLDAIERRHPLLRDACLTAGQAFGAAFVHAGEERWRAAIRAAQVILHRTGGPGRGRVAIALAHLRAFVIENGDLLEPAR